MATRRFDTLYGTSFKNPYGDDGSYHEHYKRKVLINNRFKHMNAAFAAADKTGDNNGSVNKEEFEVLLAMFKLSSENATTVAENMERRSKSRNGRKPRFSYSAAAKMVKNADHKKLERLPDSLVKALPKQIIDEAERQESLIQVTGLDEDQAFTMMNRAFCAFDKGETGLVSKEIMYFILRMFNMHHGKVRYAIARCDHNTTQRDIAYVEFIKELQEVEFEGQDFSKTFGPQPRSPHRNVKKPSRNFGDSTMALELDDSMNDLLE
jgi:Ca2+-binding EF-hand superfamily protein